MKKRSKVFLILSGVLLFLIAAFVGTGLWYLRSQRFQDYARNLAIQQVERSTGLSCRIDRLLINPWRGSFRISGFALQSRPGTTAPVQITVDEISGSARVRSLVTFKLILTDLDIVRPHIVLSTGRGGAQWSPEEFLQVYRTSLNLEAARVSLREGQVEVNDRQVPFDVSLNNLVCEVRYLRETSSYRVRVAYENGRFNWADRTLIYDLEASATVSLVGVDIDSVSVRYEKSRLSGNGWMRDWKSPVVLLHAAGTVTSTDLSVLESNLRDAGGEIAVTANFHWDSEGFRSTARFSSRDGTYRKVPVTVLDGWMELRDGVIVLHDVDGRVGSGPFVAEASFHLLPSDSRPHQLQVTAKDLLLRNLAQMLNVPEIGYENLVDGDARLSWRHGNRDLELKGDAHLRPPAPGIPAGGMRTDLQGDVALTYSRGTWSLTSAVLSSPDTEMRAEGTGNAGFLLKLRTRRIAEVLAPLRSFSPSVREIVTKNPDLMNLSGTFELDGSVLGSPRAGLSYAGALGLAGVQWRSYSIDSATARATWNGTELDLQSLKAQKGAGSVTGDLSLRLLEEEQLPEIRFHGSIHKISLDTLREFGLDIGTDIGGTLTGSGTVSREQGGWQGEGEAVLERGSYKGVTFDTLSGHVRLSEGVVYVADSHLTRGDAKIDVRGRIVLNDREMDLTVRLADFPLLSIPAVAENKLDLVGTVSADGRVRGTLDNPSLTGNLVFNGLRYTNWDLGQGKGSVELKDKLLTGDADVRSDLGSFRIQAAVSTEPGYEGKARVELKDWNARKLIAGSLPPYLKDVSTALQGNLNIKGSFADPAKLTYEGELDGARFKFQDYELSNAGKIRFLVANRKLQNLDATIVGDGTRLVLKGDIPLNEQSALDLKLDGNLNLKVFDQVDKRVQISGSAGLSVRATGAPRNPMVIGQASLTNTHLAYGDLPFHFDGVRGNIVFSRNLVRFENVAGAVASGSFQLSGALEQENLELRGMNLQINARRVRFSYPRDFHTIADADLTLRGSPDSPVLEGDVRVIRSEYTREFNLLEQIASRGTALSGPLTSEPFLVGLRLNIGVRSDMGLYVDNELARLRGGMRLTLRGTPAYPSLNGRVEVNEGAIFFRGNRFDIVSASLDFIDRNRINPVIDVRAEADVRSYRLELDVNGDLDHLRFNVSSDPPMSTVDILTLLTTGKEVTPGEITARRESEITGLSAASILSENLTGVIGKRVQRIFGLQSFRVDPFLAGAQNDPTARVTINEQVTKDLNITFSRNLSTTEEQIVIIEYEVNRNLSIIGTRDENGQFGLDFRFRKRFR